MPHVIVKLYTQRPFPTEIHCLEWSGKRESNPRPSAWEADQEPCGQWHFAQPCENAPARGRWTPLQRVRVARANGQSLQNR